MDAKVFIAGAWRDANFSKFLFVLRRDWPGVKFFDAKRRKNFKLRSWFLSLGPCHVGLAFADLKHMQIVVDCRERTEDERIAALFHEFGHILVGLHESNAWLEGYRVCLGYTNGADWTQEMKTYAINCLKSHEFLFLENHQWSGPETLIERFEKVREEFLREGENAQ